MASADEGVARGGGARFARRAAAKLAAVLFGLVLLELALRAGGLFVGGARSETRAVGPAATRLLCVGDSNTYGIWMDAVESYPARLEELLDDRVAGGPHRVVNGGFPGLGTALVLRQMEAYLDGGEHDAVLVLVGYNDQWRLGGEPAWWKELRVVRLVRLAAARLGGEKKERTDRHGLSVSDDDSEKTYVGHEPMERGIREGLARIVAAIRASGARPVLLTYACDEGQYGRANATIRAAATELGADLVDCREALAPEIERLGEELFLLPDGHPTAAGYEAYARAVLAGLAQLGVVEMGGELSLTDDLRSRTIGQAEITVDRSSGSPVIEIRGADPNRAFVVLASTEVRTSARAGDFPLVEDAVFRASSKDPRLHGELDERGDASVSLAHLSARPGWSEVASLFAVIVVLDESGGKRGVSAPIAVLP